MKADDGDLETHHHQPAVPSIWVLSKSPKRSTFCPNFPCAGSPNWKSRLSVLESPGGRLLRSTNASGWWRGAVCPPSTTGEPEMLEGEAQKLVASLVLGFTQKARGKDWGWRRRCPAPLHAGLEISSQKERTRRGPRRLLQLETVLGSRSTRFSLPFSPSGQMLSAGLHPVLRHRAGRSPEHFFWGSAQLRGPYRGGEGWKHRGHPGIQTEHRGSCLALPFPHGASSPPGPPSSAHVPSEDPVPLSAAPAPS